jgi:CrcB protein
MVWLLVGAGGALGSMARHGLNQLVHQRNLERSFPLGIFLVNVIGSAAIGVLGGVLASGRMELSLEARTFLIVGLLGGFTTFSSFSLDTLALVRAGHLSHATWNVVGQVGLSLIAVWLGFAFGRKVGGMV